MEKLTGRTRYRSTRTWKNKELVVLQVEVQITNYENVGGFSIESYSFTEWRDATTADLTTIDNVKEFV